MRGFVRRGAPFSAGVLATILGLVLYSVLPPAKPLSRQDVSNQIGQALASMTPAGLV
jgi:hypothetical protein